MRVRIASHNNGNGSRALAEALSERLGQRVMLLRRNGSSFVPRPDDVIINWGKSTGYGPGACRVINSPDKVAVAQDKLRSLRVMQGEGVTVPPFTTDPSGTGDWDTVVVRHLLRASSSRGLEIWERSSGQPLPQAPLYTKYIKKKAEYRVHVLMEGQVEDSVACRVIDFAQKKRRADAEEVNTKVRSHDNGWVFCREDVTPPDKVLSEAMLAVMALGLDFGAVDVIYNEHYDQAYVLEVNTAPGLEGTTVQRYADNLARYINEQTS